jgi:large subunit ribosomal protein L6
LTREKVGFLAAKVRDMRPPEPYKGKGILYAGEKNIKKTGKTGK